MTFIGRSFRAIESNGFFAKWRTGTIRLLDKHPPQIMAGVCYIKRSLGRHAGLPLHFIGRMYAPPQRDPSTLNPAPCL